MLFSFILRSGTEEDYPELSQLLEDISSYVADSTIAQIDEQGKRKKEEQDKIKGMEMRKAAMETHSSDSQLHGVSCNYLYVFSKGKSFLVKMWTVATCTLQQFKDPAVVSIPLYMLPLRLIFLLSHMAMLWNPIKLK